MHNWSRLAELENEKVSKMDSVECSDQGSLSVLSLSSEFMQMQSSYESSPDGIYFNTSKGSGQIDHIYRSFLNKLTIDNTTVPRGPDCDLLRTAQHHRVATSSITRKETQLPSHPSQKF
ncbi:hypothetical protein EAF00_003722 [Botryotinia globosa]|nr:hypothetical protein EAF00_003722 [Botryotinia globosa]